MMSKAVTKAIDARYYPHFAVGMTGYPIKEGYPDKPMEKHLVEYFGGELGIPPTDCWGRWDLKTKRVDFGTPYITIQAKTGWSPYKEWPMARWQEIVNRIKTCYPKYTIVQIGAATEPDLVNCVRLNKPITEAIGVVAKAKLHIGGDSFPNHVRGIVDKPAVILWGSTSPIGSGYKSSTNIWHDKAYPCSPCYREYPNMSRHPKPHCPHCVSWEDRKHPCMDSITVDEVWAAVDKELGG
jgi:ADP-heptose:LPS heptosyltransferase